MSSLLGLPYEVTVEDLLENNHIKVYDHAIVAVNNTPYLMLFDRPEPIRPIYLPTDNQSIIKIQHWKRDVDMHNMFNVENFYLLNQIDEDDYKYMMEERTNELTTIVYKITNTDMVKHKYVSQGQYELTPAVDDELPTYYPIIQRTLNYVGYEELQND